MKTASAGTASGCVVWLLTFAMVSVCFCPVAMFAGGITSSTNSDYVASVVGPWMCPPNTTPEVHTYGTTITDSSGTRPATGTEIHCNNAAGETERTLGAEFAFAWIGLLVAIALVVGAVLSLGLAVPVGGLVAGLMHRWSKRRAG